MKHIVLLGGGHAHLVTLANLWRFRHLGCRVTLVQPREEHYYSGMGPGLLSRMYEPWQIRFATRRIVENQGGRFLRDAAIRIDSRERTIRLQSGETLEYDLLSCNVGSTVPGGIASPTARDVYPVKPIAELMSVRDRIESLVAHKHCHLAIVGGGPAALEIAANARRLVRRSTGHPSRITLFAGKRFLSRFPEKLRRKSRKVLYELQVDLVEGDYARQVDTGRVILGNGSQWEPDLTLLALGVRPPSLFADSGLSTGSHGGLLVDEHLRSVDFPEIMGGGDCIAYQPRPLDKVGVHAVRQNPVLLHNLLAMVRGDDLQAFRPQDKYMLIFNTGDDKGILWRGGLVLRGRWAFRLKDRIDRKFMRRFQALEEAPP
ncbi:MAG: FAD-dependent oxidoreductase [Desulfohalobiaceae bacterium]|nr:FAD-dependent oxidoreductase [Desulfohalobiaceae bacterium]